MTNKELQEKLKELPDEMEVGISVDGYVDFDINPTVENFIDEETGYEVGKFVCLGELS